MTWCLPGMQALTTPYVCVVLAAGHASFGHTACACVVLAAGYASFGHTVCACVVLAAGYASFGHTARACVVVAAVAAVTGCNLLFASCERNPVLWFSFGCLVIAFGAGHATLYCVLPYYSCVSLSAFIHLGAPMVLPFMHAPLHRIKV